MISLFKIATSVAMPLALLFWSCDLARTDYQKMSEAAAACLFNTTKN